MQKVFHAVMGRSPPHIAVKVFVGFDQGDGTIHPADVCGQDSVKGEFTHFVNVSHLSVLQLINEILALYVISLIEVEYTKTLECVPRHFFLTVANVLPLEEVTKRAPVSDIVRTFDV